MKDYRVEIIIRNNRIIHYLQQMGYTSIAELCRKNNMNQVSVGKLINLKKSATSKKTGEWIPTAIRLAEALCCNPNELWTDAQRKAALKTNRKMVAIAERDIIGLTAPPSPLKLLEDKEAKKQIKKVLSTLMPREEDIIKMKYGLEPYYREHTYRSIADKYNVTLERIRQIKKKAIRKLRLPTRVKYLPKPKGATDARKNMHNATLL